MPSLGGVHVHPDSRLAIVLYHAFITLLYRLCNYPSPLLSRFFFMCDGIDGVEQLSVPPLDLRLILSARMSHRRRVSSMLSVVGRRCFPLAQFFVQAAGRCNLPVTHHDCPSPCVGLSQSELQ